MYTMVYTLSQMRRMFFSLRVAALLLSLTKGRCTMCGDGDSWGHNDVSQYDRDREERQQSQAREAESNRQYEESKREERIERVREAELSQREKAAGIK